MPRVQFGPKVGIKCVKGVTCVTACEKHDGLLVVGGARFPVVADRAVGGDDAEAFLLSASIPGGGPAAERIGFRRLDAVACLIDGEQQGTTALMRGGRLVPIAAEMGSAAMEILPKGPKTSARAKIRMHSGPVAVDLSEAQDIDGTRFGKGL
jgi:hypothetical protein